MKKPTKWDLHGTVLNTSLDRNWEEMTALVEKIQATKRVSEALRREVRVFLDMVSKGVYS